MLSPESPSKVSHGQDAQKYYGQVHASGIITLTFLLFAFFRGDLAENVIFLRD
jgi:hypothetical protein